METPPDLRANERNTTVLTTYNARQTDINLALREDVGAVAGPFTAENRPDPAGNWHTTKTQTLPMMKQHTLVPTYLDITPYSVPSPTPWSSKCLGPPLHRHFLRIQGMPSTRRTPDVEARVRN